MSETSPFRVAYAATVSLPRRGGAEGNRILTVAKGLIGQGCEVAAYIPFGDSGLPEDVVAEGMHCRSFFRRGSRLADAIKMRVLFPLRLWSEWRRNPPAVVIVYTWSPWVIFAVARVAHCCGIRVVKEQSEYPASVRNPQRFGRFSRSVEERILPKLYDGMLIMTRALLRYYQPLVSKRCRLFHLPMTVDCTRFRRTQTQAPISEPYIAYCGSMSDAKDGIGDLLQAFDLYRSAGGRASLVLIGPATSAVQTALRGRVSRESAEHIVFTGRIDSDQIPGYLQAASALALIRPANKQAEGGFPTKLGEYLAAGVPTVVTRVGEIPDYLEDGVSIRFVEPEDVQAAAKAFADIFDHPEVARQIAQRGAHVAWTTFHYEAHAAEARDFLQGLVG